MQPTALRTLRSMLDAGEFIVAPGVFEMFSARIADRMNFKALYMTGYGVSGSHLGVADAGIATYTDFVERARTIAEGTSKPLIADADTGFGGLVNIRQTVRGYEAAGVQAVQIEDQVMPKKCGHTGARQVISVGDMVRKIEVALDARRTSDCLIIARTDSRGGHGLDEAIRRGRAYAKAGADVVFIEALQTVDEFARAGQEIDAKLLANMVPSGASPLLPAATLQEMGFDIAIYPSLGMTAAAAAMRTAFSYLEREGSAIGCPVPVISMTELHDLVGFPEVWAFEKRFAE